MDWKLIVIGGDDPMRAEDERPGPEMLQLSTSLADQDMVEELPERKRAGFALIETSGDDTVTVVFAMAEPPGPVQVTL